MLVSKLTPAFLCLPMDYFSLPLLYIAKNIPRNLFYYYSPIRFLIRVASFHNFTFPISFYQKKVQKKKKLNWKELNFFFHQRIVLYSKIPFWFKLELRDYWMDEMKDFFSRFIVLAIIFYHNCYPSNKKLITGRIFFYLSRTHVFFYYAIITRFCCTFTGWTKKQHAIQEVIIILFQILISFLLMFFTITLEIKIFLCFRFFNIENYLIVDSIHWIVNCWNLIRVL